MGVNDICSSCLLLILVPVNPSPDISFYPSQHALLSVLTFSPSIRPSLLSPSIRLNLLSPSIRPKLLSLLPVQTFFPSIRPNMLSLLSIQTFSSFYPSQPSLLLFVPAFSLLLFVSTNQIRNETNSHFTGTSNAIN